MEDLFKTIQKIMADSDDRKVSDLAKSGMPAPVYLLQEGDSLRDKIIREIECYPNKDSDKIADNILELVDK